MTFSFQHLEHWQRQQNPPQLLLTPIVFTSMTVPHNLHFAEVGDSFYSQLLNLSSDNQLFLKILLPLLSLFLEILTKTRSTSNNQS